jgi:hypothetical protein
MRLFKFGSKVGRYHLAAVVALAALWGACATDRSTQDPVAEIDDNGRLVQISMPEGLAEPSPDSAAEDASIEKAGCVHIQYCAKPGTSNLIVCDTNDRVCSSDARYQECKADARAVCGRTLPMEFAPGIPCPITGVC